MIRSMPHSSSGHLGILLENKKEYTDMLCDLLIDCFIQEAQMMYKDARTTATSVREGILKGFQEECEKVPKWNMDLVSQLYRRVLEKTNCKYLSDLIKTNLVTSVQCLLALKDEKHKGKVSIRVPSSEHFIHRCMIVFARALWKRPYLLYHQMRSIERQRNLILCEEIARKSIKHVVREIIPLDTIIQHDVKIGDDISSEHLHHEKRTSSFSSESGSVTSVSDGYSGDERSSAKGSGDEGSDSERSGDEGGGDEERGGDVSNGVIDDVSSSSDGDEKQSNRDAGSFTNRQTSGFLSGATTSHWRVDEEIDDENGKDENFIGMHHASKNTGSTDGGGILINCDGDSSWSAGLCRNEKDKVAGVDGESQVMVDPEVGCSKDHQTTEQPHEEEDDDDSDDEGIPLAAFQENQDVVSSSYHINEATISPGPRSPSPSNIGSPPITLPVCQTVPQPPSGNNGIVRHLTVYNEGSPRPMVSIENPHAEGNKSVIVDSASGMDQDDRCEVQKKSAGPSAPSNSTQDPVLVKADSDSAIMSHTSLLMNQKRLHLPKGKIHIPTIHRSAPKDAFF